MFIGNAAKYLEKILFSALVIPGLAIVAHGQSPTPSPTPPASNIYLIEIKTHKGELKFGQPLKITTTTGYNNQPSFLPDGRSVLYTSIRDQQADIYRYDLGSAKTNQITDTKESEFSPTLMPDGKNISVVRVEADGTQRLWKFPLQGGSPSLVLEKIKPVGYHLWIDDHTLALFVLGTPNTLQIVDLPSGKSETLITNPGRIIRRIPKQNRFSFVHKISDREWVIKEFDLRMRTSASLTPTLAGVEDYAWLPTGMLLMAKDSKLFAMIPLKDKGWREVTDFSGAGLKGITRIAVSPKGDRIAIVSR